MSSPQTVNRGVNWGEWEVIESRVRIQSRFSSRALRIAWERLVTSSLL